MRHLGVAAAVALLAGSAAGQSAAPAAMPGQVVGSGINLKPVGNPVGQRLPSRDELKQLENPLMRAYDPSKPLDAFKGTGIDPKTVVAPVAGFPMTGDDPNLLERLYTKIGTVTGFLKTSPVVPQRPTFTPGIGRRNRERAEQRMWRRD